MWRSVILVVLMLSTLIAPVHALPALHRTYLPDTHHVFLPLIELPSLIDVTTTTIGFIDGYPSYYFAYGYVRTLDATPVYSITLGVERSVGPYCSDPDEPCPSYPSTDHITPAFSATLPGQPNPFRYDLTLGKASTSITDVVELDGRSMQPSDTRYEALTIVTSQLVGTTLSGTARNDSGQPLTAARIVGASNTCGWNEATLGSTTLLPGTATTFHLDFFCPNELPLVVGQGAVARAMRERFLYRTLKGDNLQLAQSAKTIIDGFAQRHEKGLIGDQDLVDPAY